MITVHCYGVLHMLVHVYESGVILHPEKHLDVYAYVVTEYTVCIDKTVTCKVKAAFKQCLLVF